MSASLEQEVKLVFESVEAARRAVTTAGGRLVASRRLLRDALFDTPDRQLRQRGCAFRIRRDESSTILTFKGPVIPDIIKSREEIETKVADADRAEAIVAGLGFRRWFYAEKYREEYELASTCVAIDDTPIGVFVEIEGEPAAIAAVASRLDRTPADYRLESYVQLYAKWCTSRGVEPGDMRFGDDG